LDWQSKSKSTFENVLSFFKQLKSQETVDLCPQYFIKKWLYNISIWKLGVDVDDELNFVSLIKNNYFFRIWIKVKKNWIDNRTLKIQFCYRIVTNQNPINQTVIQSRLNNQAIQSCNTLPTVKCSKRSKGIKHWRRLPKQVKDDY